MTSGRFLVTMLLLTVVSCNSESQSETESFRGIKWGTDIHELRDMKLLNNEGGLSFYQKTNDIMEFHSVPVNRVVYGFHEGQFYSVSIYFDSISGYLKLRESLSEQYGGPDDAPQSGDRYFWDKDQLEVLLTFDRLSEHGRIYYSYNPITDQVK